MHNYKSLKLTILVLLLISITIFAGCGGGTTPPINQYGTAEGFVKDAVTRTGIEEAIVTIDGKSNITDSNGAYLIENIPVGSQSIVVTALGYQDYNNSVTIEEGDNVIDDVLLEPGATHYEDTSNSDGITTFTLQDGRVVQTKVIDVVTGEPIPNIDSYLVTDGTDVAFLFIDPAGIYIPRIAPEEQSLRTLARSPEERAVGTIKKELWKVGHAQFSGYQPKYADQIENRFASYIFRTFFIFCFPSTLGDLKFNLWEFLAESGLDQGAEAAITSIITYVAGHGVPVVGQVLFVVDAVELGNTAAYELWVRHYTSRGYSLDQMFEIWRLRDNPIPFVFPIKEPSNLVPEENPGSIRGKVLDARTGEGIYDAQVQIVDLNLSTTTSNDGSYRFSSVPPGTYGMVATKVEYYSGVQINVKVYSEGETVDVNFVLSSIEYTLSFCLEIQNFSEWSGNEQLTEGYCICMILLLIGCPLEEQQSFSIITPTGKEYTSSSYLFDLVHLTKEEFESTFTLGTYKCTVIVIQEDESLEISKDFTISSFPIDTPLLDVISPSPGSELPPGDITVTWTAVENAYCYFGFLEGGPSYAESLIFNTSKTSYTFPDVKDYHSPDDPSTPEDEDPGTYYELGLIVLAEDFGQSPGLILISTYTNNKYILVRRPH